ncbi:carboxyl transferase domain-containing protein [Rhodococcus sp. C26F]
MSVKRLLVANRGEIAVRIMRSAADLGIETVAVASADDVGSGHTRHADKVAGLPGAGPAAYLDASTVVDAAIENGCDAIHPGYGFLSESRELAQLTESAGLSFVGPSIDTLATFGDKTAARRLARQCGVPLPTGTVGVTSLAEATEFMESLRAGASVMVKAVAGGGGRGMRPVDDPRDLAAVFERCSSEARKAFGSGDLYVEELFAGARHIEVQVVGDGQGGVLHLWDRDCSVQRRRQKVIEIAPADLAPGVRAKLLGYATDLAAATSYRSLGTVEFLVRGKDVVFLEVNPRIQVEHTVTEEILGIDLVELQLRIAGGATLAELGLPDQPGEVPERSAMQLRVTAEQMGPDATVVPTEGTLSNFDLPGGPGTRVDTHMRPGDQITSLYDSLVAKIVVSQSSGDRRNLALRGRRALRELVIGGLETNVGLLDAILSDEDFQAAPVATDYIENRVDSLLAAAPVAADTAMFSSCELADPDSADDDRTVLHAPMTGVVVEIALVPGEVVSTGQPLVVIEAMKMEHVVRAECSGVIDSVGVEIGSRVHRGEVLVRLRSADESTFDDVNRGDEHESEQPRRDFDEWYERRRRTLDEGRPEAVARRRKCGRRTARENIDDLVDSGSFVEYGGLVLAAQRQRMDIDQLIERTPADGLVTGIGTVQGVSIVVMAYDYTVMAGTQGYFNHAKMRRMFGVAADQRLPVVLFVEGGGGRPGDTDMAGIAQLDEETFTMAARLSGRVPIVALAAGRTFAGNAALASLSDIIIATADSNIGMGGPAMIEGGGLGVFRPEEIGPASVQNENGVIDVLVEDEAAGVAVARSYLALVAGERQNEYTEHDQLRLRSVVPENRKRSYDVRTVIDFLADEGSVLELRPRFGIGILTALGRIRGRAVGMIANNPQHLGGAIDAAAAEKAARFLQLCNAHRIPVVSLVDTPGFMVGPSAEESATVRRFGRLFLAGAHLHVPMVAVVLRKGYGLGAMAMAGGDFTVPLATLSWPTGEFGGMGLEGYVRLGYRDELAAITDPEAANRRFNELVEELYSRGKAISVATVNEIDDVIDPAQTRTVVTALFDSARRADRADTGYLDSW